MYYRLGYEYPIDEDGGYYEIDDALDFEGVRSWALGQPFEVLLPDPIRVELRPVSHFRGLPPDLLDGYLCLMSAPMVAALQALGAT
ncbi:MAG TPA: hypothetical protein VFZ61_34250, partial [Polyangiales bacterium]